MEHFPIRQILSQAGLSVFPVLVFLLALALIDTYRLMTLRRILGTVGLGCGVAILCWLLNTAVYETGVFSPHLWARSGAPVVEEIAKGLYVAWLIRTNRVAFMVDSAIAGFAREHETCDTDSEGHWLLLLRDSSERLAVSRRQWPQVKAAMEG